MVAQCGGTSDDRLLTNRDRGTRRQANATGGILRVTGPLFTPAIFRNRRDPFSNAEFLGRLLLGTDAAGQPISSAAVKAPGQPAFSPGGK